MLTKIREKIIGWVGIVFIGLIGVTFVFFGGANFIIGGNIFAAKVNGSEIPIMQFEQAYRDQIQANPSWVDLPDDIRIQLRQGILDSLIRERLLELHVVDAGYQISDSQLARSIQSIPDFQVDGVFDEETANSILLQNGLTIGQFRAAQRRGMRTNQLQRAIGGTSLVTPSDYRRFLNLVAEQRLVSTATFDIESVMAEVEVTDEAIATFYEANDTMFLTEESADVEFIEVRRDVVAQDIEITEDALQQYYEDNQDRYLQDEQRQARHILILAGDDEEAAEARANELLARIQAGESFEELAAEHSDDGGTAANGGDLGVLTRSQLPGELGGAIFALNEGDIDGPVKSDFGFHIVRLDQVLEQGPLPLDQVRGELLTELRDREAEDEFRELERQLSDVLFDAPDMQTIATATGLEIQAAAGFTRSGGEPIGANQAAIDAIFDQEASRRPLEDVREEITTAIRTQEAQTIVFNRAEQLLVALGNGEDFGAAGEAAGATVSAPTLMGRQDPTTDQVVLGQVFSAKKPTQDSPTTGSVRNSTGGITVFSVDAVLPGRPESIPLADRDAGKLELAGQAGTSEYLAYMQALYDNADIVTSEDALAAQDFFQ
jgi:peptidyl-prolyl cis-trans isomerase D